ncbi:MAG TPA: MATE family efflux transporter [Polyangiaceae bacterium]|nr:MATE family efflux transporter [Polyangiaceae bacterium]
MVAKDRRQRILVIALPIIGGMVSQNILNLVDTLMVSQLGDTALAAVGLGSFANFMCTAFITGLSAGVQAISARRVGEGRTDEQAVPLNGGLLLAGPLGLVMSVALFLSAGSWFPLLSNDSALSATGVPYLQARLTAMVAIGMNFSFRGYFNGVGQSRLYMRTLVIMHVTNVVASYVLIFGAFGAPELGALGAGIGSAFATWVGTATYIALGVRHARSGGFLRGLPDLPTMRSMTKLSLPAGLQQLFFAAGMTAFFAIIARVGTRELAASNVLLNLLLVALLPAMGFGMASASLVGQALGRNDEADARRWASDVSKLAMVCISVIALPALLVPDLLLLPFLRDPITLELARWPLRLIALGMPIDTLGLVLMLSMQGAGDTRTVLYVSVGLQWVLLLPAVYLVGNVLLYGLVGIWVTQLVYRSLQAGVFTLFWRRGRWAQVHA